MTDTERLEACPFCGGVASIGIIVGPADAYRLYHAQCIGCLTEGRTLDTKEQVVRAWNTRIRPPEAQSVNGELLEAAIAVKKAFCNPLARRAMGGHTEEQQIATLNLSAAISHAQSQPEPTLEKRVEELEAGVREALAWFEGTGRVGTLSDRLRQLVGGAS